MGRENQAASNSHADRGLLKGGTRRLRAHPLRSSIAADPCGEDEGQAARTPLVAALVPRSDGPAPVDFTVRVRDRSSVHNGIAMLAAVVVLTGAVAVARGQVGPSVVQAGGAGAAVSLPSAASALAATTAAGGKGFSYTVVSRSVVYAKADGPLIEVPDPADPYKVGGTATSYYAGASIERGIATPDGMWLEMRVGPATADAEPDFGKAPVTLSALRKGKAIWRNDGEGWYVTDGPPGIGLDLASLPLVPRMLRNATGVSSPKAAAVNGKAASAVTATALLADLPGIMAVDAASYSEITEPVDLTFDAQGRLAVLHARVRNTRVTTFDLIVDVTVTFDFDSATGPLPDPVPLAPSPTPSVEQ